jgi:peptide/nickel transport system permease protein
VIIGLTSSIIEVALSVTIGSISGLTGGKFDLAVQRFVDAWMSMPQILILMTVMSILGRGLVQVILVIAVTGGIRSSRIMRSAVIGIKENVYVEAARVVGCSAKRLLMRYILPNIMAIIIISFTINLGSNIMLEASLSFLGFGVPPGVPSWGSMLSGEGRQFMEMAPMLAIWPGLCLSITVYGVNMLGDALRDLLDPRLRGGLGRYGGLSQEKLQKMVQRKKT